jgi:hypothetical protein
MMFFKLLTLVVVILAAVWMLARRPAALPRRDSTRTPARLPRADDLVSCGRCGVWLRAGDPCGCAAPVRGHGA